MNYMEVKFKSESVNESFARVCIASFCLQLHPSVDEINDIKTAVSEAVTNAVVHAYPKNCGEITMRAEIEGNMLTVSISDNGVGIKDIQKAIQPFYTTCKSDERSGMGFTIMESFMDSMDVEKNGESGTKVTMTKAFSSNNVEQVLSHTHQIC